MRAQQSLTFPRNVAVGRTSAPDHVPSQRLAVARRLIVRGLLVVAVVLVVGLIAPGFILDPPVPVPTKSDAIVVISGDEQMARFREGLRLYRDGYGKYLVFSGAAYDSGESNADVMGTLAQQAGISENAILEDPQAEDTWGNAVYTLQVLQARGLYSVILVTSPYHLRRAEVTFDAAYANSGISVQVHAAPDSDWRKLSWWQTAETRDLTASELAKLAYINLTGRYH